VTSPLSLLIISHSYLPQAEVGALRIARLCRYLPEFGIRPIVLTVGHELHQETDDSYPALPGVRVERTGMLPTPLDLYRSIRRRGSGAGPGGSLPSAPEPSAPATPTFLRRQARAFFEIPDTSGPWCLPALRRARALLAAEPVAAIFSSVPPYAGHLVARSLRKELDLPWLADFRDPWTQNPLRQTLPWWRRWVDRRMESSCLRWADRVICNTDRLRTAFSRFHPEISAKLVTLTNGFDDPLTAPPEKIQSGPRCFLHLGSLYGQRRIDTFCRALTMLVGGGVLDPATFKVLCVGDHEASFVREAAAAAPELVARGCIEFRSRVNWEAADRLRWEADLLLLFFDDPLAVPAKFYEYLPTGKPILAVTPEGALTDVLERTGAGVWARPDDVAGIASKLRLALGKTALPPDLAQRRWAGEFHFRSLAGRLAGWVKDLVQRPTASVR
jgi:glycosyltransferase involved in cell wall biosynthesis